MTTATEPRYRLSRPEAGLIPPEGCEHTPRAVRAAADKALQAEEVYEQALAEVRAARADLKAAPAHDRSRDREAVALGQPLPEERLEHAAKRAVDAAERRLTATDANLRDCQVQLALRIQGTRDEWMAEQASHIANLNERAHDRIAELAELFNAMHLNQRVLDGLRDFPADGNLAGLSFGRERPRVQARRREHEAHAAARIRESATVGGGSAHTISLDVVSLLAGLALLAEHGGHAPTSAEVRARHPADTAHDAILAEE